MPLTFIVFPKKGLNFKKNCAKIRLYLLQPSILKNDGMAVSQITINGKSMLCQYKCQMRVWLPRKLKFTAFLIARIFLGKIMSSRRKK